MADAIKNFAYGTVLTPPSPATTGTSLVLNSGQGARLPDPAVDGAYNIVMKPAGTIPLSSNAEIARVTAISTDTLTIVREQEGSSARTVIAGDEVYLSLTKAVADNWVDKDSAQTITGIKSFSATPKMDAIAEKTAGAGVTIDSVLLKDGGAKLLDASVLDWTSGAKIERNSGDIKLTPETGKFVEIAVRRQGGSATQWYMAGTTNYNETGVIIQCGVFLLTTAGTVYPITFPTAFSDIPLVICSADQAGAGYVSTRDASPTSIKFTGSTSGQTVHWIAIGKSAV